MDLAAVTDLAALLTLSQEDESTYAGDVKHQRDDTEICEMMDLMRLVIVDTGAA